MNNRANYIITILAIITGFFTSEIVKTSDRPLLIIFTLILVTALAALVSKEFFGPEK